MKKIMQVIIVSVFAAGMAGCDLCTEKTIALVDMDAIAKALGRDEAMKQEIASTEQQLNDQLNAIASKLQAEIVQEQGTLNDKSTDEDKQRVEQFILQAQQTLRNEQLAAQQKSTQLRSDLITAFRDEIKVVAEAMAKEQGIKMVKIISADVLWSDPTANISDAVVTKMQAVK